MWGLGFAGLAAWLKDPEWKIDEDEAKELSARASAAADAFQSDKASKLVQWIKKHEPELFFLAGLLALIVPRLYHTFQKVRREKHLQTQAAAPRFDGGGVERTEPARPAGPQLVRDDARDLTTPAPSAPIEGAPQADYTGTADNGRAPLGFQTRPFSRADLRELDSLADDRPM